jgi:hypothetical protein
MSKLIKFPLENSKEHVLVEVEEVKKVGLRRASPVEDEAPLATITLNALLSKIKPIASAVTNSVAGSGKASIPMELEFGIKLNEENNVILSQLNNQNNFIVRIKIPG